MSLLITVTIVSTSVLIILILAITILLIAAIPPFIIPNDFFQSEILISQTLILIFISVLVPVFFA